MTATEATTDYERAFTSPSTGACVVLSYRFDDRANEPHVIQLLADDGEPAAEPKCYPTKGQVQAGWKREWKKLLDEGFSPIGG